MPLVSKKAKRLIEFRAVLPDRLSCRQELPPAEGLSQNNMGFQRLRRFFLTIDPGQKPYFRSLTSLTGETTEAGSLPVSVKGGLRHEMDILAG